MFSIGDLVVHPMHGAGVIDDIVQEKVAGVMKEYYVFKMPVGGLVLKIPTANSQVIGIRGIISQAEAEELLCRGGYAEAIARTAPEGGFCHNAYKGEALRQETDGRIFVGNFDKCSAELPLADLAAYIRRYFKKTEGTAAGISAMLERYGRHCPLSERDMILLQGMLLYPEKFLRLINEYYNRRRTCVSPAMRERLAAAAKEELNGVRLKSIIAGGC